ncbi:MAG: hypothetical protein JWP63_1731, partial [Candidatus Solibacter sp.]|nr:hypothetical protein [Candidatus Solibacter sp.]
MASEAGGRADKLGNEFERLWAVRHIIELLSERATSVLIEPPGDDERGTEFWVGRPDGTREAHQCKRENGTVGNWSAADLETKKVISNAAFQLRRDPSHCYFFVSGDKVTHVYDLTERARSYENPAVFRAEALTSSGHQRDFQTICRVLALHPDEPADLLNLFDILRRLHFRIADKEGLRNDVEELAHRWIDGDPRIAVAALKDLADKSIGRTLRVDDVISHLAALSIRPRDLATDLRLRPALHELRARFARSYCHLLIGGATLGRRETYDILELLNAPDGPRLIMGHGSGGDGKSGVGFELNGLLAEAGVVCLPLRLDRDRPADSPRQYGQSLDLPASPAACLAAAANGQSGVLLLDQVDALRWTAAHSSHAWDTVERLVAEALNYPNLRVVLMCRSFDTEENPRIKAWKERTKAIPFRIGPLDDTIVDRVAATVDVSAASIDAAQRRVLRSPQGLYLFWRVMQGPGVRPPAFRTMTDLMRKFWELVRAEKLPDLLPGQYDLALGTLVRYMDAHGTLTAPMSCVTQWPKEIQALQSMNVLVKDARGRLLFAHQSYLDYLTAERVLHEVQSGKGSVMDWLRTHDQSLFRRGQLRQLLALLRDDDPSVYAHSLRSILVGDSVRFHLRHLALQLLGHADPPENSEVALVLDLAKDNAWLYHLSSHVLVDRPSWFDALNDRGVVRAWLNGMDEKRRKFAFGMLERVLPNRGNIVEPLLLEGTRDKAWRERFEAVVWRTSPEKLTGPLFGVYVRLVRRGSRLIHFVDWKQLAVARPKRFVRLLKACLERDERNRRKRPRAMKKWLDRSSLLVGETLQAAANAAAIAPAEMWDRLLPLLRNALSETRALQRRRYKGDFHRDHIRQQHIGRILRLTRTVLVAAGRALAATARGAFWSRIDALKDMKAASISRVLIRSITAGSDDYADAAIRWLLANPSRLHCGAGGRGATYRPARALLLRYAALCSEGTFAELQARILAYWPKRERWTFECRRRKYVGADVAS